jgi:hypothetical protein
VRQARNTRGLRWASAALIALALPFLSSSTAQAGTGYLTTPPNGGAGKLLGIDSSTWQVSQRGNVSVDMVATASHTDGKLYGIGGDFGNQSLYTIDTTTGASTPVGPLLAESDPNLLFSALTSAPGGVLYAASYRIDDLMTPTVESGGQLYTVNAATGHATPVGDLQTSSVLVSLAGSCQGTLFGVDDRNYLVTVNRSTGAYAEIGRLDSGALIAGSFTIAFDHGAEELWALDYGNAKIYGVDSSTAETTPTNYNPPSGSQDASTIAFDSPAQCDRDSDGVADPVDKCPNVAGPASNSGCPVPAARDTRPPETSIIKRPKDKSSRSKAKFKFSSSEAGSSFACRLDKKKFKPCVSPKVYKVRPGKHTFEVRATDAAGNVDPTSAKDRFKVLR